MRLPRPKFTWLALFVALLGSLMPRTAAQNLVFKPGKLAVLQLGDGGAARGAVPSDIWASRQNPYFIDQFEPIGVNQTVPTAQVGIPSTGPDSIWVNGNAGTEGNLTLSADRTVLAFGGYCGDICSIFPTALPTPPLAPSNLNYDRGIGTVDAFGKYVNAYRGPSWYGIAQGKTNPRGVVTDGAGNFWGCGNGYGSLFYNANTGESPIQVQNLVLTSCSKIINNTLYNSVKSGESGTLPPGIYSHVGFNLKPYPFPTSASFPHLEIPADPQYQNCIGFDINPAGDTAYVADNKSGIQKYIKVGQAWKLAHNLSIPGYTNWQTGIRLNPANTNTLVGCFSVTVDWAGQHPVVFATTGDSPGFDPRDAKKGALTYYGNRVIRIDDYLTESSGENIIATTSILTTVVQAPVPNPALGSNYIVYKSVAFTPDLRPLITQQPSDWSAVVGDTVQFKVTANSKFPVTYQWYRAADILLGESRDTLTLPSVQLAANGSIYRCVVASQYGSVTSANGQLTVTPAPVAPTIGSVQTLTNFIGGNYSIVAKLDGTDAKSGFQWLKDGAPLADTASLSGTRTTTLQLVNAQASDSGAYSIAARNAAGSSTSLVANLVVKYAAPVFVQPPAAASTFTGRSASFSASVAGFQTTARWYFSSKTSLTGTVLSPVPLGGRFQQADVDGQPVSSTLTIDATLAADATNFVAVFANGSGSITSAPVSLKLFTQPASHSFVNYTNSGQIYTQNFDALPIPGGGSFEASNPQNLTYVVTNITGIATNINFTASNASVEIDYSIDNPVDFGYPVFPSGGLGGFGLAAQMGGWYGYSAKPLLFAATSGDQSAAGLIDNGLNYNNINGLTVETTNRSLGLLTSSKSGTIAFGVGMINNSGRTLNKINIGFTGALWRNNPIQQPLLFGILVDPNGASAAFPTNEVNATSLTYFDSLQVAFATSATTEIRDGTRPANQQKLEASGLTIPDWAPGTTLWLVWQSGTSLGGAQNVAIDNVRFSATGDLTQTIQWAQIPTQSFTTDPLVLGAVASSGLPVAYEVVDGPATVTGDRLTFTGTGVVRITARQDGGGVFVPAAPVTQSFTVQRADQTIAFAGLGPVDFFESEAFLLNATASSGLPVTLTVESGPAILSGSILVIQGAGNVVIAASQDGDSRFAPAPTVRQTVQVRAVAQTITFTAPEPQVFAPGKTVTLQAAASSGLPVTFGVSGGPATVVGNVLTLTGAGTVQVTASQAGNSTFAPAAPVTQSIAVAKATQVLNLTVPPAAVLGMDPVSRTNFNASSTAGLPVQRSWHCDHRRRSGGHRRLSGCGARGSVDCGSAWPVDSEDCRRRQRVAGHGGFGNAGGGRGIPRFAFLVEPRNGHREGEGSTHAGASRARSGGNRAALLEGPFPALIRRLKSRGRVHTGSAFFVVSPRRPGARPPGNRSSLP